MNNQRKKSMFKKNFEPELINLKSSPGRNSDPGLKSVRKSLRNIYGNQEKFLEHGEIFCFHCLDLPMMFFASGKNFCPLE